MSVAVSVGVVVAYLVVALAVGLGARRFATGTAEDYYLAGRGIGTAVLLFTTFATLLSAFTFFAGPNIAYKFGPEWFLVMGLMDGVLFGVLWYLLGYRQWLVGRARGHVTLGELLGDRFGSRRVQMLVAGVSLFWLFPYVMLQQKGAGTALAALTDGAVPVWAGATLVTVFMIAYVVLAGMRGVAWTDTLQGVFMLLMVWAATAVVLFAVGGPAAATARMGEADAAYLSLGGGVYSPQWMLSQAVTIAVGVTMFPQVNQRFFVAKSKAVLQRTLALWPVLCLLLFLPAFMLGAWAVGLDVAVPEGGNVLPAILSAYSPGWFAALVIAGALAAMMSSSDSMLLSGSAYATRDLYRPLFGADEAREARLARVGVVLFASLALVGSLATPATLFTIGETAFGGFAQLAPPVALTLYWRRATRNGVVAGIAAGQLFYVVNVFLVSDPAALYAGWGAGAVSLVLTTLVTVVGSVATSPASTEDRSVVAVGRPADEPAD